MDTAVIITNFNHGRFIGDAINSVYTQTVLPKELVIVDDCSTDGSVARIKELLSKRPKTINTKVLSTIQNGGVAIARNMGIMNSKAPIIGFLDADDLYYPTKIERSLEIFEKYNKVGLVYSDYDVWDTSKNTRTREFKPSFDFNLLVQSCIVSTNSIVRRTTAEQVGGFNPNLSGPGISRAEDYEMWVKLAQKSMVWHIPESLFCYRLHGQNVTVTHPETVIEGANAFRQHMFGGTQK